MRLIDAKAFQKRILDMAIAKNLPIADVSSALYLIEKQPTVTEQESQDARKWTPVTERLPEKNEDVLVFYTNSEIQVDFIANDGDWFWEDREDGIEAIAWMPLPELYKPE